MRDMLVTMHVGEKRPIYGSVTAPTGTVTFTSPPTFLLRDNAGNNLATSTAVTGYNTTPAATMSAWVDLDTGNPPGGGGPLTAGVYVLQFQMAFTTSADAISRTDEPTVLVCVAP